MRRVVAVIFVDDWVYHDGLLVDSEGRVRWNRDPALWFGSVDEAWVGHDLHTSFECQRFTSNQNDIRTLVSTIHLVFSSTTLVLPCSAR